MQPNLLLQLRDKVHDQRSKTSSKIGQDQKTLVPACTQFLTAFSHF